MIQVIEYAKLSSHVYGDSKYKIITTSKTKNIKKHLDNDIWIGITDAIKNTHHSNPYFAQLYIKFSKGEAVDSIVSIRGTKFSKISNIATDANSWLNDVTGDAQSALIPNCMPMIHNYYIDAWDYVAHHFPHLHGPKLTGHSLGGSLAQLLVANIGIHYPAVTFNAPGIAQMPGVNLGYQAYIHNVNSRYGLINKIGPKIGELLYIDVPNHETEAKLLCDNFDKKAYEKATSEISSKDSSEFIKGKNDLYHTYYKDIQQLENSYSKSTAICQQHGNTFGPDAWISAEASTMCESSKYSKALEGTFDAIKEQHSITNIIKALNMTKNKVISERFI